MSVVRDILFVLIWARVRWVARGECCFGVMYCDWYGVCDFVRLSVVGVCDYGGVNVFHVCLYFGVVYSGCGVVCVVVCCLFLTCVCCLLHCSVVIFVLSMMRVVGGVPSWVECVFRHVDVVCLCLLNTQLLF